MGYLENTETVSEANGGRLCSLLFSSIKDNPYKAFYDATSKHTYKYAIVDKDCDTNFGHPFRPTIAATLVNFVNYNIHDMQCSYDPKVFDFVIADIMSHYRYFDLQLNFKLKFNDTEIIQVTKSV